MPRVAVINIDDSHRCEAPIVPPDLLSMCSVAVSSESASQTTSFGSAPSVSTPPDPLRASLYSLGSMHSHTYLCRLRVCRVSRNWTGQRHTKNRLHDRTRPRISVIPSSPVTRTSRSQLLPPPQRRPSAGRASARQLLEAATVHGPRVWSAGVRGPGPDYQRVEPC